MRQAGRSGIELVTASRDLWDREYGKLQIIPSSTRTTPSKALLVFSEILRYDQMKEVLDVGCGNGRNAVYLAQKGCRVHALDFSGVALRETRNAAFRAGVEDRVHVYDYSLIEGLPFKDERFDLVVDSYVFCHFLDEPFKHAYRREIRRVTRLSGNAFCSAFSKDDQYYGSLIEEPGDATPIVVDPRNGIAKQLYTLESISDFFSKDFSISHRATLEFEDSVQGIPYWRQVIILILGNSADTFGA